MSVSDFDELVAHRGHKVEVVTYNESHNVVSPATRKTNHQSGWHEINFPVNVAIECRTCEEVLLDYDRDDSWLSAPDVQAKNG